MFFVYVYLSETAAADLLFVLSSFLWCADQRFDADGMLQTTDCVLFVGPVRSLFDSDLVAVCIFAIHVPVCRLYSRLLILPTGTFSRECGRSSRASAFS
jgi:hypothetical protein